MAYDCPNWVWMNNTPCANCVANGRDAAENVLVGWAEATWEAKIPLVQSGEVRYLTSKELAAIETNFASTSEAPGGHSGAGPTARPS